MRDVVEPIQATRQDAERSAALRLWVRRAGLGLMLAVVVLALCNVFGQRASNVTRDSSAADLVVHSPTTVRAGLLFQGKITILAHQTIHQASLVVGSGWFDGLTMNTNEPSAASETSGPDGSVILSLGNLAAGSTYVQYFEFQVNPTSFSSRSQTVTLRGGGVPLVTVDRTMRVVP